jgi:hypothetical protein
MSILAPSLDLSQYHCKDVALNNIVVEFGHFKLAPSTVFMCGTWSRGMTPTSPKI